MVSVVVVFVVKNGAFFVNHVKLINKVILPVEEFIRGSLDKSLHTSVHLGGVRITKVMGNTQGQAQLVEV